MTAFLPNPVAPNDDRPFVYLNASISADGKLAPANRVFEPFTNSHDERFLHLLRTRADAVMAGHRTVATGDVKMDAGGKRFESIRLREGRARQNLRILVSATGSVSPSLPIFSTKSSPVILLTTSEGFKATKVSLKEVAHVVACGEQTIDWKMALSQLYKQWGVRSLLCEGGGELNGALIQAGVVDEVYTTIVPFIFGGRDAPTLADSSGFQHLAHGKSLVLKHRFRRGTNLFFCFKVLNG